MNGNQHDLYEVYDGNVRDSRVETTTVGRLKCPKTCCSVLSALTFLNCIVYIVSLSLSVVDYTNLEDSNAKGINPLLGVIALPADTLGLWRALYLRCYSLTVATRVVLWCMV